MKSKQKIFSLEMFSVDFKIFLVIFILLQVGFSFGNGRRFVCKDGSFVGRRDRCNGIVDCMDGSDESAESCQGNMCPSYTFQCAYGACIAKHLECDGNKDCWDGSDEICSNPTNSRNPVNPTNPSNPSNPVYPSMESTQPNLGRNIEETSNCGDSKFTCGSGECIDDIDVCDGRANCLDVSDEMESLCKSKFCPGYAFRCDYGACISGTKTCDQKKDCMDGSDESSALCSLNRAVPVQDLQPLILHGKAFQACSLPAALGALEVQDYVTNARYTAASRIDGQRTVVKFSCKNNEELIGSAASTCVNGTWLPDLPKCKRSSFCEDLTSTDLLSREIKCFNQGLAVECRGPLRDGTQVHLACRDGFVASQPGQKRIITCQENGLWEEPMLQCVALCNEVYASPSARKGPWTVSIFKSNANGSFTFKANGIIISPTLVKSDVMCSPGNCNNDDLYRIVEGDFRQPFMNSTRLGKTFHNVFTIKILRNPETNGTLGILEIEDSFRFSDTLAPICNSSYIEVQPAENSFDIRNID